MRCLALLLGVAACSGFMTQRVHVSGLGHHRHARQGAPPRLALRDKLAVEVDLGAEGEPKGVSRLSFVPTMARSRLVVVDLRVPLGMLIEERDDGRIEVTGALPGYSAIKEVRQGDVLRAVTGYRMVMAGAPMWKQVISYTPQGKLTLKRLVYRTEGASYNDVREAISSHRLDDGGNGVVTLVLERVVGEDERLPFDELPPAPAIEPLRDVILRDLQTPSEPDEPASERQGLPRRARSFFGVDQEEEDDDTYYY